MPRPCEGGGGIWADLSTLFVNFIDFSLVLGDDDGLQASLASDGEEGWGGVDELVTVWTLTAAGGLVVRGEVDTGPCPGWAKEGGRTAGLGLKGGKANPVPEPGRGRLLFSGVDPGGGGKASGIRVSGRRGPDLVGLEVERGGLVGSDGGRIAGERGQLRQPGGRVGGGLPWGGGGNRWMEKECGDDGLGMGLGLGWVLGLFVGPIGWRKRLCSWMVELGEDDGPKVAKRGSLMQPSISSWRSFKSLQVRETGAPALGE